jgi:DNA-directed RNA polymerase subunit N (RpoN/RPB10)
MFNEKLNFYELPPIRCKNCNKPIAHLYDDFLSLIASGQTKESIFQLFGLEYCCRKEFFTPKIPLNTCDEFKIFNQPTEQYQLATIIYKDIDYKNSQCTPMHIKINTKQKKLSDNLYVSYTKDCTYICH